VQNMYSLLLRDLCNIIIVCILVGLASADQNVSSAFESAPLSVTIGQSVAVNYTVLDTNGSGLKQVELWRKDGDEDWKEISRNSLAGETGVVSGLTSRIKWEHI